MAYGMAVASLQKAGVLRKGTMELTEKGKKMTLDFRGLCKSLIVQAVLALEFAS